MAYNIILFILQIQNILLRLKKKNVIYQKENLLYKYKYD